jgi:hypothetical protein
MSSLTFNLRQKYYVSVNAQQIYFGVYETIVASVSNDTRQSTARSGF